MRSAILNVRLFQKLHDFYHDPREEVVLGQRDRCTLKINLNDMSEIRLKLLLEFAKRTF